MAKARDYKKEYRDYHGKPEQIKRRATRVKDRRDAESKGLVKKGDGKEVDHQGSDRKGSLENRPYKVVSKKANRKRQPKRS